VGDALERLLAPFLRTRCGVPGRLSYSLVAAKGPENRHHALYRDCSVRAHDTSWARLGDALFAELNLHAIEGFAEFAVHAGVVAEGDRVIAFPAESEAGKSTMTAACLGTGFQYVSDEALCVDFASGRVLPYPKPIMLSEHSRSLLGIPAPLTRLEGEHEEAGFLAGELGAGLAEGELRLGDVLKIVRREGGPELRQLHASEAVSLLLRMSFNHYKRPRESFDLVTRLARETRVWELGYHEPVPAAELLRDRLSGDRG
jgi:hypothetical protein